MYPSGTAMSPPLPLLLEFGERALHPLLCPDESVPVPRPICLGHKHLVTGFDELAHVLESDQTVDPVTRLVRAGCEEVEIAADHVDQPLSVGGDDRDEEAIWALVRHAVPPFMMAL